MVIEVIHLFVICVKLVGESNYIKKERKKKKETVN